MKKIYLLNDYITSKNTLIKIKETLSKKYYDYEIISLDFFDYYKNTELKDINLNSVVMFFLEYLNSNLEENDVLVGVGLSARILVNFKNNKRIFINPLVYNNLFNVFCARQKCFENTKEQFKTYLNKFVDLEWIDFEEEYHWYSKNHEKIIKLTENINLYETLKSLKSKDLDLFENKPYFCLSIDDEIVDIRQFLKNISHKKFLSKYKFKIFSICSDKHLMISEELNDEPIHESK